MAQDLLGVIVGRGHAIDFKESEQTVEVSFWIEETLAKVFSFRMMEGLTAEVEQAFLKGRD